MVRFWGSLGGGGITWFFFALNIESDELFSFVPSFLVKV